LEVLEGLSKHGKDNMNVSDAIRLKRAVRKFSDQPLPEETIRAILNAGRRAQSSKNTQPWHFIAITDQATLKALSECGEWAGHLAGAALGVALLSEDPAEKFQRMFDLGQCAAYMQLAAWELGVGSCLASIYEPEKARQLLGFPENLHLRIAISFGYPLDDHLLSAPPRKGGRRSFDEAVHRDRW
jgi:nitroreductase